MEHAGATTPPSPSSPVTLKPTEERKEPADSSSSSPARPDVSPMDTDDSHAASSAEDRLQQPSGGVLLGWGCGMFGLLGSDDESTRPTPVQLPLLTLTTSVAVGSTHALAVGADGTLFSWGANDDGQLGLGDRRARSTPTELPSLQTRQIVAAAAGYAHSLALSTKGEVLAFGAGEMGALGLTLKKRPIGTPPDLSTHVLPALVKELAQLTRIIQVACGDTHSLALSSAGRVYAVGDGSRGSLGLDFKNSTHIKPAGSAASVSNAPEDGGGVRVAVFTELSSLLPLPIASIAAGAHHSLFVSSGGSVYSCGDASKGRLGYSSQGVQWLPRRITGALDGKFVISASAGSQFSLFLTQGFEVYSTGSNAHGEAGFDGAVIKQLDTPTLIPGLPPILQISAGSTHALARDSTNRVWSFGSGEMGELGRGLDASLLRNSTAVGLVALPKVFPHQHIVSVAAGSNTSFVIVAQTMLTSVSRGPASPHKIVASATAATGGPQSPATYALYSPTFDFQSAASTSSSVAASSSSSVAVAAPSSPQFIVRPSASPLSLNAFSYSHFSSLLRAKDYSALASYITYVFSSALILNASFLPRASVGGGSFIDHNLLEIVYQKLLKATLVHPKLQHALASAIQRMVSSMVQLMKQTARKPPQDIAAYRAIFVAFQSPHLMGGTAADTAVLADLAYILTRLPREVAERVSTYLYQHVPLDLFRIRFLPILLRNIERRMQQSLHGQPIQMRIKDSTDEMQDLVRILEGIHTVTERRMAAKRALKAKHHGHGLLLEDMSGRNSPDATEQAIPESAWHLSIDRYMDLQTDLANFVAVAPTAAQLPVFSFMRFPWMLSPATKAAYLRVEFDRSMQNQALGAAFFAMSPTLDLKIRRTHIVEDTVMALNKHSVWELRRPLKVQFVSQGVAELGEDQGGLSAEFFELALQKLFEPQYALWEARSEWKSVWFSSLPTDPSKSSLYQIVGMLIGMSLYNACTSQLNFPIWLWAQLLGLQPTLQHLHSLDPQLADSLQELLDFEGDVENIFCLNFSVDVPVYTEEEQHALMMQAANAASANSIYTTPAIASSSSTEPAAMQIDSDATTASSSSSATSDQLVPATRTRLRNVPLLPGGESIAVTQANKSAYVKAYLQYLFHDSVRDSIEPLVDGFQQICSISKRPGQGTVSMSLFSPHDLELVVVGARQLDFKALQRGARYEGGYSASHPTIAAFWEIVQDELSPKEKRSLLLFTTGSSRAPVAGLSDTHLLIQRAGPDTESLPTSSTCFHALILPQYDTKAKLAHKLKLALANAVGFGLR